MENEVENEIVWLERLKEGDTEAFALIYEKYKLRLTYKLIALVKSEELVEELLQDLFMKIWENRAIIDTSKSFKAYLYKISINQVYDLFRRAQKEKEVLAKIKEASLELYSHVEEVLFEKENFSLVQRLLEGLPQKRRLIFEQCKLHGKSYKEVAEEFQISVTTVNDHIQKSMAYLRSRLTTDETFSLSLLIFYLFS